jgi:hypothetical protein
MIILLGLWSCLGLLVVGGSAFKKAEHVSDVWVWLLGGMALWVFCGGLIGVAFLAFIGGLL